MEVQFEKLLTQVTDFMHKEAKTETIIGKPFTLGEFNCIPIVKIGMGFGTGGGGAESTSKDHGEGAGIGAGMGIEPIGFLVSKGDQISFVSTKTNSGLNAAFEKVPLLIESFMKQRNDKQKVLN